MTSRQEQSVEAVKGNWGICPTWRLGAALLAIVVVCSINARTDAAFTEPRLALLRVSAYRSTSGTITLKLEGSFSHADAMQLGLPLNVIVTQGALTARFDLAGNVFTSTGGAEQPASGPGVVGFAQREIVLVLPAGFSAGASTAQIVMTYDNRPISSNRLSFTL